MRLGAVAVGLAVEAGAELASPSSARLKVVYVEGVLRSTPTRASVGAAVVAAAAVPVVASSFVTSIGG